MNLIQISNPKEITIIIADDWKNDFVMDTLKLIQEGKQFGDLMKLTMQNPEFRPHGKIIKSFLGKLTKHPGKYRVPFKTQKDELEFFLNNRSLLEREIGSPIKIISCKHRSFTKVSSSFLSGSFDF